MRRPRATHTCILESTGREHTKGAALAANAAFVTVCGAAGGVPSPAPKASRAAAPAALPSLAQLPQTDSPHSDTVSELAADGSPRRSRRAGGPPQPGSPAPPDGERLAAGLSRPRPAAGRQTEQRGPVVRVARQKWAVASRRAQRRPLALRGARPAAGVRLQGQTDPATHQKLSDLPMATRLWPAAIGRMAARAGRGLPRVRPRAPPDADRPRRTQERRGAVAVWRRRRRVGPRRQAPQPPVHGRLLRRVCLWRQGSWPLRRVLSCRTAPVDAARRGNGPTRGSRPRSPAAAPAACDASCARDMQVQPLFLQIPCQLQRVLYLSGVHTIIPERFSHDTCRICRKNLNESGSDAAAATAKNSLKQLAENECLLIFQTHWGRHIASRLAYYKDSPFPGPCYGLVNMSL
jgi:hypothetical protein